MKKILLLMPGVLFLFTGLLNAQTLNKNFVTTNGAVRAIIQKGDTAFIGGDFTQVGMQSRGIAMFAPGETTPDINFPQLGINNTVNAIENDGNNGFYLAGNFTNFNGTIITTHSRILHVLRSGSLDPLFGTVITDGDVYCMKLYKGKLYIGGIWKNIQNTNRPYLAALDATTGALDNWLPATPDNAIEKIEVSTSKVFISGSNIKNIGGYPVFTHFGVLKLSDGAYVSNFPVVNNSITAFTVNKDILYLGGNFDQAGASARGIAKLSSADANADPNFPSTNGMVLCILPDGNGGYYIGGNFTKVGNKSRSNLAHILKNGAVDAVFNVTVKDQVLCLAADDINLYFGGDFTSVNGLTRHYVAAVSKTTGALAAWNPSPDSSVLTLLRIDNIIYLGGWFTKIKNTNRNFAAAVTTDGNLNNWTPQPDYYVNQVIAGNDGSSVFMCGGFNNVKASAHEYVVKVNKTSGTPTPWHPKPDNVVKSIALSGSTVYMAGSFSSVDGKARLFLAAVDTISNTPTSFTADLNNFPNSINIASGKLYIAGNYSQINGVNISYISRVDLASGIVDEWNPVSNAYVGTIYSDGKDVIAGGNFTLMNGLQKNLIASVNLSSNHFTTWNANGVASFNVNTISKIFTTGSDILIGGNFSYFDGFHSVHNMLVIDSVNGNISHLLTQYPTGTVNQFAIYNNKLMVGGSFTAFYDFGTQSNISRNNIAAYNKTSYSLSSAIYDANNSLTGMFTNASGNLIISGNFSLLSYVTRNYLAAINLSSGKVLSWNPSPDNTVNALAIKSSALYVGGTFKHIAGQARNYIASISVTSGKANTWSADCDSTVSAIATQNNVAYIGGLFTRVKGTSRTHTAAISTTDNGSLKSWAPNPDSAVNAISTVNNIYIGGRFSKIENVTRNKLAKINSDGTPDSWSPNPDNSILCFSENDSAIFVGGDQFTTISKKSRNALAAFSINNNAITSFNPKLKFNNTAPRVNALALNGNILYIGTSALDELNGVPRGRLAAANITNNNAINFNPLPDSSVTALSVTNNYLLAGGLWNNLGNNVSPSYFAVFNLNAQSAPTLQKYFVKNNQTEKNITASNSRAFLYPNPAVNTVTINFKEEVNSTISLMNIEGKTIWIKDNFIGRQLRLSVENLTSGTYFVLIETGKNTEKLKFVKK